MSLIFRNICYTCRTWLWNIARGICGDEVEGRLLPKSHGSGKTFPGPQALKTLSSVQKWLYDLCEELNERLLCDLEQNKRVARTLSLHASAYKLNDSESLKKFPSKSCPLRYGIAKIQEDALNLFHAGLRDYVGAYHVRTRESKHEWAITGLSVSASKIVVIPSGTHSIMKYFQNQNQTCTSTNELNDISTHDTAGSLPSSGNGNVLQLHSADTQIDTYEDETRIESDMNLDGDETEVCKARMNVLPQKLLITKIQFSLDWNTKKMGSQKKFCYHPQGLKSGAENGSGPKFTRSKMDFLGPGLKSEKQKRKLDQEKGTPSILSFFNSQGSCSFPEHAHIQTFQETGTSSSGKLFEENQHPETRTAPGTCKLGQDEYRTNGWSYKSDEIDPTVLSELPPEIQAEVRASLQPQKRVNTVKRGSSIVHYFTPTSNS
ncbi:hypothetical protein BUALT_Bualt03G0004400 [Buddleja alternifolia]|uniref:DNA polymerase Y-family little finger domain-containing protein n=1 Tax=Buddleja alternifolia TaxID=168488 RepID=A0AAV6XWU6_9LAMI|nr:hypothetical protein BUALT_Bualt03G0004400 [Buddleja alternifolia]